MKAIVSVLSILVVGTIASLAFIFYQNYKENSEVPPPRNVEATVTRDSVNSELASFLREAQGSGGEFIAHYRCNEVSCAEVSAASTTPFGYAIRGLLASAEATENPQLRRAADLAMERTLRLCESDPVECSRNFFALQAYYEMTGEESYKNALLAAAEYLTNAVESDHYSEILIEQNVYEKLEHLYELTGDAKYRDLIVAAAEELMAAWPSGIESEILFETDGYSVSYHMPIIANGLLLPAYRVTGDATHLDAATEFFMQANISENLSAFRWAGGTAATLNALEGLIALSESDAIAVPERASFEEEAKAIMARLVGWQYDSPERTIHTGDHGFVTGIFDFNEPESVNYKSINLNGWIALLLTDEMFEGETYPLYILP